MYHSSKKRNLNLKIMLRALSITRFSTKSFSAKKIQAREEKRIHWNQFHNKNYYHSKPSYISLKTSPITYKHFFSTHEQPQLELDVVLFHKEADRVLEEMCQKLEETLEDALSPNFDATYSVREIYS